MKLTTRKTPAGLTRLELLIVIVIILVLVSMFLPAMGKAKAKGGGPKCVNNQRQIGTAFRVFASDNGELYPLQAKGKPYIYQPGETNTGPGAVVSTNAQAWQVFQALWNELQTPKVLRCPQDTNRFAFKHVSDFNGLAGAPGTMTTDSLGHADNQNRAVSYTALALAVESKPLQLLSTDRNIKSASSTNAAATMRPRPSGIRITVASASSAKKQHWINGPGATIHGLQGNLTFADGSVQQGDATVLQQALLNAGAAYGWGTPAAPGPGASVFLMP